MTTTKILSVLLCVTATICISFIIAFIKKKNAYEVLAEDVKPYAHWTKFDDGTYAIPLTTKLYVPAGNSYEPIGTVADNFAEFSKISLEEALEEAYYGNFASRTYLSAKILAADYGSNAVVIGSSSGKRFIIMRNEDEDFPESINIKFPKKKEN